MEKEEIISLFQTLPVYTLMRFAATEKFMFDG